MYMNPRHLGYRAIRRGEDSGMEEDMGSQTVAELGSGLTWSWTGSLLGPSTRLVEKSTAHFSSVTDSVPFRSHRLIFFRS
jgi:hypothetical protein